MITMYHTSNPNFRNKILKEGLIPQIGENYELHNNGRFGKAIFLCIHVYDSTWNDDIYEVKIDKSKLNVDIDCFTGCYYVTEPVPIHDIKLIYKGNGKSKY